MAVPVFCNVCFCEPRKPTPRFSLTSCGHVICEICLQKDESGWSNVAFSQGKNDECLICRIPCHTLVLSKQNLAKLKQGEEDNATKSKKITANQQNANIIQRNNAHSNQIKKPQKPLLKLLKQTNPDIQSLFMGIDALCKKYSKEISQISEFQEKHRKHLLAYHRQKSFTSAKRAYISHKQYDFIKAYQTVKLEESLKKVTQQMHQIQCMKLPEQTTQRPFSSASRNPLSIPSRKQDGYSSCSLHPSHPSSSEIMESMEIDPVPSPMRKPETPTGPTRLSLITPPQDGRMGSVSYRGTQSSGIMSSQNSRAGSTRSTPIKLPHSGCSLTSSSGSQSSRRGSWAASDFRTPQLYPFTSPSPQSSVTRQPITISGLLQRQHLGSTNLGGHSTER